MRDKRAIAGVALILAGLLLGCCRAWAGGGSTVFIQAPVTHGKVTHGAAGNPAWNDPNTNWLVACYTMDTLTNAGGLLQDSSLGYHHAHANPTLATGPTFSSVTRSIPGSALNGTQNGLNTYDGADDAHRLFCDGLGITTISSYSNTWSCWVKPKSYTTEGILGNPNGVTTVSLAYMATGAFRMSVPFAEWGNGNPIVVTSPATYPTGVWHHVMGTYNCRPDRRYGTQDEARVELYVDGVQVGASNRYANSVTWVNNAYSTYGFYAGSSGWSGDYLKCDLDSIRLYNKALTNSDAYALWFNGGGWAGAVNTLPSRNYAPFPCSGSGADAGWDDPYMGTSLKLWYPIQETTNGSGQIVDKSGNTNHSSANNTVLTFMATNAISGSVNRGDPSYARVTLGNQFYAAPAALGNNWTNLTMAIWIYCTTSDHGGVYDGAIAADAWSYIGLTGLYWSRSDAIGERFIVSFQAYHDTAPQHRTSSYSLPINRWIHIVGVYDKNVDTPKLYIDGVLNTGGTAGARSVPHIGMNDRFYVGTYYGKYFWGGTKDFRLYDKALSSNEVWNLYYNTGGSGNHPMYFYNANVP